MRIAILQQSYGRFGGAERLFFSHYAQMKRMKKDVTAFYGPSVSRLRLSNGLYRFTTSVAKAIDIATVRGYGKILANSVFLSKFLVHVYNLKKTPKVVYPGADPLFERRASRQPAEEQDYMLAVGSLVPLKNFESIIRAAAAIQTAKLVFVGDGQDKSKLKDLASKLDVPVEFRGNLDHESDLATAYSECKFLVLLSLYETFGLTPVEEGLFSKTAIVTSSGGPPEVIVDGVTGFVVDPVNHQLVRDKMNLLLANDSLRRKMGHLSRENILRNFTLERSTAQLIEELESS